VQPRATGTVHGRVTGADGPYTCFPLPTVERANNPNVGGTA
jgi:hypothetical protein